MRSKIAKTGLAYIKTQMSKFKLPGPAEARNVARQALNPDGGELYWASKSKEACHTDIPASLNELLTTRLQGLFMSPCVLVSLAQYLTATENSVLFELNLRNGPMERLGLTCGLPEGALTMAVCAVRLGSNQFSRSHVILLILDRLTVASSHLSVPGSLRHRVRSRLRS